MSGRVRLVALFLALGGSVWLSGQAQQPQPAAPAPGPTFRTQVEYVEVDALVADQQGNFVRGLQKDDFQVIEDGQPQTISTLSLVDLAIERGARPSFAGAPVESDVQSNERRFDGRVYVIVLDDLHVDVGRSAQVKQAARQFIERNLGANDLMAVTLTGRADAAQEFTSNKRLLLNAVDTFQGSQLQSSTLDRNDQYHRQIDLPDAGGGLFLDDLNDRDRAANTHSMLTTLRRVSAWLGGIRGRRKTMLLFSEGMDYDLTDLIRGPTEQPSAASTILGEIRDTLGMTARSNVSIYAIDPRGLSTAAGEVTVSGFADQADPSTGIGLASQRHELSVAQESLRQLSEESGGFAAVNGNSLAVVFDRIVRDNSSYYVLAYYPPSTNPDGRFHRIDVKVNRPGLTVRARRGYAAPRAAPATPTGTGAKTDTTTARSGGMPRELSDAMNSLLPVSGLTMRVFAAPFKGAKRNASVMIGIELSGDSLSLGSSSHVDIAFMALDRNAKVFGARHDSLPLNLRAEDRARVEQGGIRVLNRLDLPPGRYRLRAAALDDLKKQVGSVVYDLDVPDFYKESMAMSGVTVTSLAGTTMMTAILDEQMKEALPAPFVARRAFAQNDQLDFFAEVYDNSGKTAHKIDIVATVVSSEGRQVFQNREQHDSSELKGSKRAFGYTSGVPLSGLAPGDYVWSVEARSRLGTDTLAIRQVPFRVTSTGSGARR